MVKFWELFGQSVIVQSLVTAAFVGTFCYLSITGQEVTEELSRAMWVVLAFWMGSKTHQVAARKAGQ